MDSPLIHLLQQYQALTPPQVEVVLSCFETRHFKEGTSLFQSGRIIRELFFICKGVLRILLQNDKGVEVTHFFLKEGQFCTILHSFHQQVIAEESIQAACDTEVLAISRTRLLELYKELPFLQDVIDRITQKTLLEKVRIRNAYLGYEAAERYQRFLELQPDIALRVPVGDIASYLGITPQSLSRIRRNLR